ncbi:MAG TPA: hypothetical protein VHS78_03920 [Candidatus Elarobacter sp.]|jgi:hypothetical protein|nr:hypothetical protein [Candidatus Elarobacter sp.]
MPCTDPRDVTRLDEAFDLTTTDIHQWELELIWTAEDRGELRISSHARRAADDDSIPDAAIMRVVRQGVPRSKDITRETRRQIGINFEGKRRRGGWLRAKVGWLDRYIVATVHAL